MRARADSRTFDANKCSSNPVDEISFATISLFLLNAAFTVDQVIVRLSISSARMSFINFRSVFPKQRRPFVTVGRTVVEDGDSFLRIRGVCTVLFDGRGDCGQRDNELSAAAVVVVVVV